MAIQISGCTVVDNNRCLTNIANSSTSNCANTYVIRDANGRICISGLDTPLSTASLGDSIEGGTIICRDPALAWIVAPDSSEVVRNWYGRVDSITLAEQVSGCTDWFIPTSTQLQNPGRACRNYWNYTDNTSYWSSQAPTNLCACVVCFPTGAAVLTPRLSSNRARSFRCVTY